MLGGSRTPTPSLAPRSERSMSTKFHHEHLSGVARCRTAHGRLAKRSCAPAPTPNKRASGATRTPYLPFTRRTHHLSCCAGVEPAARVELAALPLQGERSDPLSYTGVVPSARLERAPDQVLDLAPLPLGYEGVAGSPGFEPERAASEATTLPVTSAPNVAGGAAQATRSRPVGRQAWTLERLRRVELRCSPRQGDALPLSYNRIEPPEGLEPSTCAVPWRRSTA